jgi:hypothetical protein
LFPGLKKEGETVIKGDSLLVETEKAVLEIDLPTDGILTGAKGTKAASSRQETQLRGWFQPAKVYPPRLLLGFRPKLAVLRQERDIRRLPGSGPGGEISRRTTGGGGTLTGAKTPQLDTVGPIGRLMADANHPEPDHGPSFPFGARSGRRCLLISAREHSIPTIQQATRSPRRSAHRKILAVGGIADHVVLANGQSGRMMTLDAIVRPSTAGWGTARSFP